MFHTGFVGEGVTGALEGDAVTGASVGEGVMGAAVTGACVSPSGKKFCQYE